MEDKVLMPRELTAENGAKGLMLGEFKEDIELTCPQCNGGALGGPDVVSDDCDYCGGSGEIIVNLSISWPTIKAIYAMAVENLSLPEPPKEDK